jgi:hypothetical protein
MDSDHDFVLSVERLATHFAVSAVFCRHFLITAANGHITSLVECQWNALPRAVQRPLSQFAVLALIAEIGDGIDGDFFEFIHISAISFGGFSSLMETIFLIFWRHPIFEFVAISGAQIALPIIENEPAIDPP